MLAAATARGGDAALGGEGRMVQRWAPGGAKVLLGQPNMTQRLAAGATHGRCEGDGALQWAVLLAAASASEDCGTEKGGKDTGKAAVHSK